MKASKVIVIGLAVATVVAGSFFLPVRQWFTHFENYVETLGVFGPIVVAAVYVLCTVLLIPGSAISIGAGTLFGLKTGFLVVLAGANLGALCSFLLARSFLREKVAAWASGESEVSIFGPGDRQARFPHGFAHPPEPGFSRSSG